MDRKKRIATPEALVELYEDYFNEVKSYPIKIHDFVGKEGISVFREKERPVSMDGFYCYCYKIGHKGIRAYFENQNGHYGDYAEAAKYIRMRTKEDQIQGGMVGIFNASLTARLNGLTEKTEVTTREMPLFPDVQENLSDK